MAASRVNSEVGECQLTSATAAILSRSSNEARVVIKSWTDHNHHVKYIEESLNRSKFHDRDHPSKHSNNGNSITENHCIQNNEEWSEQEEKSLSKNKIHIANRLDVNKDTHCDKMDNDISNIIKDHRLIANVCKENNESFSSSKNKLDITCTNSLNNEIEESRQIFNKCNQTSEIIRDIDKQTCAVREIKIATAPADNCINNPSESAYCSQSAGKTIGSGKCERARDIESCKNDCDEGGMEISSPRSRAYSHGDNAVVSAATLSTSAFREALRGEASRKVVHPSTKESRAPGKTRRSTSARSIDNRGESRDRKMDIAVSCDPADKKRSSARKCENCGEPHFSYGRYSRLWKYTDYLSRKTANQDTTKIAVVNRTTDSTRLATPVAAAVLYRSRSLPRLSIHDSGVACSDHMPAAPEQTHAASRQLVADLRQLLTLKQHYYPEGGWGWVVLLVGLLVQILSHGTHGAIGVFFQQVEIRFGSHVHLQAGIGVGMTRDCSTLMVAQYFKRKRELVEIFIVSGSGLGIAVMSAFIKGAITKIGWRLGLQAVTGVVFLTFILGTFYRSASLYHPQRRAILHLKNQKRKIKDKNKADGRPPFFDFSTLRSKTVRILLVSTGISAFGINTPIFYLAHQVEEEGLGDTVVLLQAYLGLAWTLGCIAFGLLVVHRNVECRIARQYLTQAAVFVCGLCILALTAVQGNYHGYVMFAWIYGIFCGGYHYSLKMYTYERVRARNFARTWGFVQCSQAIPIAIGVPISGYINVGCGGKAGYYFSSTCVLVGSFTLFFIDLHRRNLSRHKHRANGTKHTCASNSCPKRRRPSFSQEPENEGPHVAAAGAAGATAAALVLGTDIAPAQ
ncbi:hypothetical protein P5V15_004516, partial [Pogonomyrmex californicus]